MHIMGRLSRHSPCFKAENRDYRFYSIFHFLELTIDLCKNFASLISIYTIADTSNFLQPIRRKQMVG